MLAAIESRSSTSSSPSLIVVEAVTVSPSVAGPAASVAGDEPPRRTFTDLFGNPLSGLNPMVGQILDAPVQERQFQVATFCENRAGRATRHILRRAAGPSRLGPRG